MLPSSMIGILQMLLRPKRAMGQAICLPQRSGAAQNATHEGLQYYSAFPRGLPNMLHVDLTV